MIQIYSIQETANWLGINRMTLNAMRARGEFAPEVRLSEGRVGFVESDLLSWLESRKVKPD